MSAEHLVSANLTTMATQPIQQLTEGEGAPGRMKVVTDTIAATAVGLQSIGSYYQLCRIPTNAKIKRVTVDIDELDLTDTTPLLVLDFNIAFSGSAFDYTSVGLQSTIPKTAKNGSVSTIAAYSTPNLLFGSITQADDVALAVRKDITFNGTLTGWNPGGRDLPLWDFFGFVNNAGNAQDPGGCFTLLVYVATAAGTGQAGNISAEVQFV